MPRSILIRVRRGTAAQWSSANPVLAAGEIGHVADLGRQKIGDGATAWNSLPYAQIAWADVTGKPSSFTPAAHSHSQSEVTGLVAALGAKVDNSDARLSDARTPTTHTHPASAIVSGTLDTARILGGTTGKAVLASETKANAFSALGITTATLLGVTVLVPVS